MSGPVDFTDVILRRLRLGARQRLSPAVFHDARLTGIVDHVTDRMIVQMDAYVWEQAETTTHTIVEEPVYPSWRHHLAASLPPGLRRRFIMLLWELEEKDLARRIEHQVTATAHATFPQAERVMPPDMGTVVRFASIEDNYWRRQ